MHPRRTYAESTQAGTRRQGIRSGVRSVAAWAALAASAFAMSACTLDARSKIKASIKKAITTPGAGLPADPTQLVVTSKSVTQVSLGWTDNASNETSYELERCAGLGCSSFAPVGGISPLVADAVSATDATIAATTYYSYRVRAVAAKGNSAWLVRADVPPAATRLVFTTAPSGSNTAGYNFPTQPALSAYDAATHTDSDYAAAVTLSAFTDASCVTPAVGTLSGNTLPVTAGVAGFSGVKFSVAGTIYIKAASGTLTPACSGALTILAASADHLVFATPPSSTATAGVGFGTQPIVAAQDILANTDPAYVTPVTLTSFSDATCATPLAGTLAGGTATTATGLATFAGVSFTKAGALYLKATSGALTSACSALVTVGHNAVTQLSYSTAPSATATAGVNLAVQPQVTALDVYANPVLSYGGAVTLGAYTDVACSTANVGTLAGASATATAGTASFAGVNFDKAGPLYLKAGDGVRTVCAPLVTVSPAAVSALVFTVQPSATATALVNLTQQPTVTARDALGNTVTGYATTITLGAYGDATCTTLATGTLAGAATTTAGVAPFTGVNFDKAGALYLKAGDGARTVCSALVTVAPAAASKLAFAGQPSATATAGAAFGVQPTVVAQDASSNTATTYAASITLSAFTDAGCLTAAVGSLSGTPVTATSGVSAYASVAFTKSGTVYLKATSGALTSACSSAVNLVGGAINALSFTTQPSATVTAGAGFAVQPAVSALDSNANVATSFVGSVTLTAHTDAGCLTAAVGTLAGSPVTASAGVSTYATVSFTKSGTIYLKAANGALSACSGAIAVGPGAATQLAYTTQPPATAAVGANFSTQPVITAQDAYGNTSSAYALGVTLAPYADAGCLTAAAGVLSGPTATPTAGVLNFSGVKYDSAATIYLKGTDGALSVCSSATIVSISPVAFLVFTTQPGATDTAGAAFATQPVVQARDSGNALIPSFNGTLSLSAFTDVGCLTAAPGTLANPSVVAAGGNGTFSGVSFDKSGTYYLKVTDGGVAGCSSAINVSAAALSQIAFTTQPSATNTAGTNFAGQPVVKGQDAHGNPVPSYNLPVTLSAFTDVGCLTAAIGVLTGSPVVAATGAATFTTVNFSAPVGVFYFKAQDGVRGACSSAWNLVAGGATKLSFSGQPSATNTAGVAFGTSPTVVAQDASSNTATTYSSLVTIAAFTDAGCLTAAVGSVANGTLSATSGVIAYSNVSFPKSGTYYFKATAAGLASTCSNSFVVNPDAVTQLAFTTAPSATNTALVNFATQPVVAAQDAGGNVNPAYGAGITLSAYADVGCLTAGGGTLNGGAIAPSGGISTYSALNYSQSGTIYLKATSGALSSACTGALTVNAGAASQLVFSTAPSATNTAGVNLATQPVLTAQDASTNVATGYATAMTITAYTDVGCLTAAGALTNGTHSTTAGVAAFANLNYTGVGTIYFKGTSGAISSACTSALSFVPGPVTQLAFSTAPSATNTAGVNLSTQPRVQARDASNNVATTYTTQITISAYTDAGCLTAAAGTVSGGVIAASGGISTYTALSYAGVGTVYFKALSDGVSSACTSALTFAVGAPSRLAFTTQPNPSSTTGVIFVPNPIVAAQDVSGTLNPAYSGGVTLTPYLDAACLTAAGGTFNNHIAATSGGIATFPSLRVGQAPGTYYFKAASGAMSPACSNAVALTIGPVDQLFISTYPSGTTTAGVTFPTQPVVSARDYGLYNIISGYTTAMTVSAYTDNGCLTAAGGTLSNGVSATTGGIASFSGVTYSGVGTFYLQFQTGTLKTGCAGPYNFSAGAVSQLAFTTAPSATNTAGANFATQPIVAARDAGGNLNPGYATPITLSAYTDVGCLTGALGTLNGGVVTASGGISTYTGVNYSLTETIYLKALSGAHSSACTGALSIGSAGPSQLAFTVAPSAANTAGSTLATQPKLEARDSGNVIVPAYTAPVTLSAYTDVGCLTAAAGTVNGGVVAASGGIATYTAVNYTQSGTFYFKAASAGLFSPCTSALTFVAGATSQLGFTVQPGAPGAGAGSPFSPQPKVAAQDANGNLVAAYSGTVTLEAYTDAACSTAVGGSWFMSSNTRVTSGGIATFSGALYTKAGTTYYKATSGALAGCSAAVTQNPNLSHALAFVTQPVATGTVNVTLSTQPSVTVQDVWGNPDNAFYSSTVTLAAYTDSGCASAAGGTLANNTATVSAGNATFANVAYSRSGTYYLKATGGIMFAGCSNGFTVGAGATSKLGWAVQPGATNTASTAFATQPVVVAQDVDSTTTSAYSGTVTLAAYSDGICSTPSPGTTGNTTATSGGTATFTAVAFPTVGTYYFRATSGAFQSPCSTSFTIAAGAASKLAYVSGAPSGAGNVGTADPVPAVTEAQDLGGNRISSYTTGATLSPYVDAGCLTASTGSISVGGTAGTTAGRSTFASVTYDGPTGPVYFQATSGSLTPVCSPLTTYFVGTATKLTFTTQPGGTAITGTNFSPQPVVTVQDSGGNTATAYSGWVTLSSYQDSGCLTASSTGLTGNTTTVATGVSTYTTAKATFTGTLYLKAEVGSLATACSSAVNVTSAGATALAFVTAPSATNTVNANFATQPKVAAKDSVNATVTSYTAAITLAAYTDSACLTAAAGTLAGHVISPSGGISTYTAAKYSGPSGTFYLRALSDGLVSPCTSALTLAVGTVNKLGFTTQPGPSAVTNLTIVNNPAVAAQDAGGNTVTGYGTAITLGAFTDVGCLTASGTNLTTAVARVVTPTSGVSTFTAVKWNSTGTIYVKATSGALTFGCSQAVVVGPPATKLGFVTQPSATNTAAVDFSTMPIVAAQDASNVTMPSYTTAITVTAFTDVGCLTAATGGVLSGPPVVPSGGLATFAGVNYTKTGTYYLKARANGLTAACSTAFTIAAGPVSQLGFGPLPTPYLNSPVLPYVQVEAQDAGGNVITSYSGTVTLAIGTNPSGATLSGTKVVATTAGVAMYGGLSFNASGTGFTYVATAGAGLTGTSAPFNVSSDPVPQIATATNSACAVRGSFRNVYCWGSNLQHLLGLASYAESVPQPTTPVYATVGFSTQLSGVLDIATNSNGGHYCVITSTNGVKCWGDGEIGQNGDTVRTTRDSAVDVKGVGGVGTLGGITALGLMAETSCGVGASGKVYCWGRNDDGQAGLASHNFSSYNVLAIRNPADTADLTGITQLSAGYNFGCGLDGSGNVYCWGANDVGQLGDNGANTVGHLPNLVAGIGGTGTLTGASSIGAGDDHACAVVGGKVACWGKNNYGQLGRGTTGAQQFPGWVRNSANSADLTGITQVAGRLEGTCALTSGGNVYCWGRNYSGNIGDNTTADYTLPQQVHGVGNVGMLSNIVQISASVSRVCARDVSNNAYCWGWGIDGALGNNNAGLDSLVPVQVAGFSANKIVTNESSTCILNGGSNDVRCFGSFGKSYYFSTGQTGNHTGLPQHIPALVNVGEPQGSGTYSGAMAITANGGSGSFCVRTASGEAHCWGMNDRGQLGDGTFAERHVPTPVVSTSGSGVLPNLAKVFPGWSHSCAIDTGGAAYCWGSNEYGQIGVNSSLYPQWDNKLPNMVKPRQVKGVGGAGFLANLVDISVGEEHSCAVDNTGAVYCWGDNANGRLGDNTTTQRNAPVQVHGVGNVGMLSNVAKVIGAQDSNCALTNAGTVYCWGQGTDGQLGNNTGAQSKTPVQVLGPNGVGFLTGVVQVTSGAFHYCAVVNTGYVYCWGNDSYGALGTASGSGAVPRAVSNVAITGPLTDIISASAGDNFTCFQASSGAVYCTGQDSDGQLGAGGVGTNNTPYQVINLP